jgi:predicted nucleic acid-binding protein
VGAYYFDSGALAKCYIREIGSSWVRGVVAPVARNDVPVVHLSEVEVASAIVRRRKAGAISPADAGAALAQLRWDFANEFIVMEVAEELVAAAISLVQAHELRAYDAIQLAAALKLTDVLVSHGRAGAVVVSADAELNAAALAEGLTVEDPNARA